jgi:hypothetical protein
MPQTQNAPSKAQRIAHIMAYALAAISCSCFFFGAAMRVDVFLNKTEGIPLFPGFFPIVASLLIVAWLLNRFATSLFPFGKQLFKHH